MRNSCDPTAFILSIHLLEILSKRHHMRRNLWIDGSQNDVVLLKAAQLLCQHLGLDSWKGLLHLLRRRSISSPIAQRMIGFRLQPITSSAASTGQYGSHSGRVTPEPFPKSVDKPAHVPCCIQMRELSGNTDHCHIHLTLSLLI
jgi:hypothetical protein